MCYACNACNACGKFDHPDAVPVERRCKVCGRKEPDIAVLYCPECGKLLPPGPPASRPGAK